MNIAVIGATGMVGERTVTEATARGHQWRAIAVLVRPLREQKGRL